MSKITATIYVGHLDEKHGIIIPTHQILLTENDRSVLILSRLDDNDEPVYVIPSPNDIVDDIFLTIAVYILHLFNIKIDRDTNNYKSLIDILSSEERNSLYRQTKEHLQKYDMYLSFYISHECQLNGMIEIINSYPLDIEIIATNYISSRTFNGDIFNRE